VKLAVAASAAATHVPSSKQKLVAEMASRSVVVKVLEAAVHDRQICAEATSPVLPSELTHRATLTTRY